jgi:hypothetical protein
MNGDNVIDFAARRQASPENRADRALERDSTRAMEADGLLRTLRETKRLTKADQLALVSNLGHLIIQFDAQNSKATVKRILESNEWEKRKRYIRFPNEATSHLGRYAGSGGAFARIIERLIEVKVNGDVGRDQARSDTTRKALRGTSFLPPSPFRMPEGIDDADATQFATDMNKVLERLAEETDLAEFLALVSKHPIYPETAAWHAWNNSLRLQSELDPNPIYKWGWDTDEDEFEEWIPWWAPKCVIGHLYIPFRCKQLVVPEDGVAEIKKALGDTVSRYSEDYYSLLEPFLRPELKTQSTIYHRLPIWLIALPLPNKIVPCLYAALHLPGGFYPNQQYPTADDPVNPCFVGRIGEHLSTDAVYFPDNENDDYNSLYVHVSDTGITAIGTHIDGDIDNLKCDFLFISMSNDIPKWLRDHPVQRFLQLTMDFDAAKLFALSPRKFWGRKWESGDDTIFRPAFPDAVGQHTPGLRQDTIAAYLLRNMVDGDAPTVFGALKDDALIKHKAAREVIDCEVSKFREAFDRRYDK